MFKEIIVPPPEFSIFDRVLVFPDYEENNHAVILDKKWSLELETWIYELSNNSELLPQDKLVKIKEL